jgi:hypothetical protein
VDWSRASDEEYNCDLHVVCSTPTRSVCSPIGIRRGQAGSPRLFVTTRCEYLIEQFRAASVKAEGKEALDIVDPGWESEHGHAHAALRYLCMGRYGPSPKPGEPADYAALYRAYDPDEGRRARLKEMDERTARHNRDVIDWIY